MDEQKRLLTPPIKKDYDTWYRGIMCRQYTLDQVPLEERTYELCLQAVTLDGLAMEFVPLHHKNYEMRITALNQNRRAIRYLHSNPPS